MIDPPYWAVIFTSKLRGQDPAYDETAARMEELASRQPGYLGIEHARGADGVGITVSYWRDEEAIRGWKAQAEHQVAQRAGRERWYQRYEIRVARVERAHGFSWPTG